MKWSWLIIAFLLGTVTSTFHEQLEPLLRLAQSN
jgi:hypothetical protein